MKLSSQFFQPLSENNSIRYRKRIGRGGRIFIDRAGYRQSQSGGKTKPGISMDESYNKYRFDSDASDQESDMEVDEMQDK
jgi:hypothetical protein